MALGIAAAALLIAAGIGFSSAIPSWDGVGAAWTSFLPWTLVLLIVLGAAAVIRRAWWGHLRGAGRDHGLVRGVRPAAHPGVGGRSRAT